MDFKTLDPAHRHFVAAPLVLLVAILTLGTQDSPLWQASALEVPQPITVEAGAEEAIGGGVSVAGGEEGASLETSGEEAKLLRGSILLKAEGFARLTVDPWTLTVLDGAAFVERAPSGALSVAAITSNVLVEDGNGRGVVIPVSKQWKGTDGKLPSLDGDPLTWGEAAALRDIPQTFFREQRRAAQGMTSTALPAAVSVIPDLSGSPWMLPSAQSRSLERNGESVFGYIRSLLGEGEWPTLQAYLSRHDVRAFLQASPLTRQIFPPLALQSPDAQRASLLLLPFLAEDPDAFLLLSLHPVFHVTAWILPRPVLDGEKQALLLLSTPRADTLAEAFSEGIHARWLQAARDAVASAPLPHVLVQLFMEDGANVLQGLQERGYLHRLVRYAEELGDLAELYAEGSPETGTALGRIRALQAQAASAVTATRAGGGESGQPEQPAPPPPAAASLAPEEIRSLTYAALRDAGALFTVRTEIRPLTTGKAAVEGIIFGGTAYSFEFDPVRRTVGRIVQGTSALPFSLPFGKFVEWAREG